jgi:HD-GYP domain-containing protein (c-di-GMP phosphodiesterase class II)
MAIDYKKELEAAARSMILIHEPDTLIKMIVRTIVQKVVVTHAGILLHQRDKDTYILNISRGPAGLKIPKGFARMDADNPLIRFFRQRYNERIFNESALVLEEAEKMSGENIGADLRELLKQALYQMEIFDVVLCIPSYFRHELLGLLLLGKKKNGEKFAQEEIDFFIALASDVAMAIRNAQLFKELEFELERKHRLFIQTTVALAAAIDASDHYTHDHIARVTSLSLKIAGKINQKNKDVFDAESLELLHIASLLHDIGKIGVPDSILNKEGPLTEEEKRRMEEHPVVGAEILSNVQELEGSILGVKYHHEKYDGTGYPEGLKGDQIPLIAGVIAVADAFDAMTTDRPYRKALSKEAAVKEIESLAGKQFNPQVVVCLIELYQEGSI